jgi:hypothetical protein
MARLDQPIRRTAAIYIKTVNASVPGGFQYIREPYNVVSLDFGDGTGAQTYVELNCGSPMSRLTERQMVYDEIRVYDSPPFAKTRIGYGSAGQ